MDAQNRDDEASLSSLRPPSSLELDEALLPPLDPSVRQRVLTPIAQENAIEVKRKNFNHVKNKLKNKQSAFFEIRQEFHNGGHKVEEFQAVRDAYTTFQKHAREYQIAALEYLSLTTGYRKEQLRRNLSLELVELNRQLKLAYEFLKDDRDEQRARITIAADVHVSTGLPPPPIRSTISANASQVLSTEDPDAIVVDTSSAARLTSTENYPPPRPPSTSKTGTAGSKGRGSGSGSGSGSLSSSARRRLAQQKA